MKPFVLMNLSMFVFLAFTVWGVGKFIFSGLNLLHSEKGTTNFGFMTMSLLVEYASALVIAVFSVMVVVFGHTLITSYLYFYRRSWSLTWLGAALVDLAPVPAATCHSPEEENGGAPSEEIQNEGFAKGDVSI